MTKNREVDGPLPRCNYGLSTKKGIMVMSKTLEVYKSNALAEASYRLTPSEQGIILSCISQIRKDEEVTDQTMYKVSVSDYAALTGADPTSAYRDIKSAAMRLLGREVRIYSLPNKGGQIKNKRRVLITGWVQSIEYSDDGGEVCLRFSHDMLPYLTNLSKNFTKYALENVAKMTSSFGVRLYEILIQWNNQSRKEEEVSVVWLKKTLQIETKYKAIKDFKKYVLEVAVADINKHSDLQVTWEQRKTGRRVTHLKFKFGLKKARPPKKIKLTEAYISKHANLGESRKNAIERLKAEAKV